MRFVLHRRSLAVLAAGGLVALATASTVRVFEPGYRVGPSLVVVALVTLLATLRRPLWPIRIALEIVLVIVALAGAATGRDGGGSARLPGAPFVGLKRILEARWPVPVSGAAGSLIALVGATAAVATVEMARSRRFRVGVAAPSVAVLGVTALLGAPGGPPSTGFLAIFGAAAVIAVALAHHASTSDPLPIPTGRALVPVAVIVVLVAALPVAASAALASGSRFDPRRDQLVIRSLEREVSPLSRLDEWRTRQPADVVFTATGEQFDRWRLVGLTRYDGQSWMPAADFRPTGLHGSRSPAGTASVDVEIGSLRERWLPAPDRVDAVSVPVASDGAASALLTATPSVAGERYRLAVAHVDSDPARLAATAADGKVASALVDGIEIPTSVNDLAVQATAGARSDYERAQAIANFLRKNYQLDPEALPGHTLGLLQLFLEGTHRGRDEQFVAAYGLLAAAVGLPVRIVVGFAPARTAGVTAVKSSDILAWPEVDFVGVGWVRFDTIADQTAPPSGRPVTGAGADQRPATPPPSPPTTAPTAASPRPDTTGRATSFAIPATALRIGGASLALLVIVGGYITVILVLKRRRRSRLRSAPGSSGPVVGAFAAGVDVLVDYGMEAKESSTDLELAARSREAVSFAGEFSHDLTNLAVALAERSTSAVYSPRLPVDDDTDAAWAQLAEFESSVAGRAGRWRALRSKLSWRSLTRGLPFPSR